MKKVLILIAKCILVMVPLLVLMLYSRFCFMRFCDGETPYYIWNRDFCNTQDDTAYDVVILGDSAANAAFVPEYLSEDTIDIALGGTTPIENYYTMKDYLANHPAPKDVFVSYSDWHLGYVGFFWERTVYTHRYTPSQYLEMYKRAKEFDERSILDDGDMYDLAAYELYMPSKYVASIVNAKVFTRYKDNIKAYSECEANNGRYIIGEGFEWQPEDSVLEDFYVAPIFDYYYRELISLCDENNINVHIVKLPHPDCEQFSDEYVEKTNSYYELLMNDYDNVTFDWIDSISPDSFFDGLHLNDAAAKVFCENIKSRYPEVFR